MNSYYNLVHIYNAIKPIIDIVFLAYIFYKIYEIVVKTQGGQIFRTVIVFALIYFLANILQLETILSLLKFIAPSILVSFIIVFQPELRQIILHIGHRNWGKSNDEKNEIFERVLTAADILSKRRRGMLTVFARNTPLKGIIVEGTILNADVSSPLVETIFSHDNALHDGAIIIQNEKIHQAACFLPSSEQYDIKKTFGTRHRAALGLAEKTDAVVLVVSEETGAISLAYDSKLYYDLSLEQIKSILRKLLDVESKSTIEEVINNEER